MGSLAGGSRCQSLDTERGNQGDDILYPDLNHSGPDHNSVNNKDLLSDEVGTEDSEGYQRPQDIAYASGISPYKSNSSLGNSKLKSGIKSGKSAMSNVGKSYEL